MKKIVFTLIVVMIFCVMIACSVKEKNDSQNIIEPPVRISYKSYIDISRKGLVLPQNFDEAYEKALVIAHLRIGNYIGEYSFSFTIYEAEVVDVYKGELPNLIRFVRYGSSELNYQNIPLLTYGNEILAFLLYYDGPDAYYSFKSYYEFFTEYDVIEHYDGTRYVVDRTQDSVIRDLYRYVKNSYPFSLFEDLTDIKIEKDPFWKDHYLPKTRRIYKLDELGDYIRNYKLKE